MALSTPSVPVSEILKSSADSDEPKKKSREDWRKAKELEEARKVFISVSLNIVYHIALVNIVSFQMIIKYVFVSRLVQLLLL